MNRFEIANVYKIATDEGSQCPYWSFRSFDKTAAWNAAENARSWRSAGMAHPGRSAAPPRPVGVKK
jgi:hypothetical protein